MAAELRQLNWYALLLPVLGGLACRHQYKLCNIRLVVTERFVSVVSATGSGTCDPSSNPVGAGFLLSDDIPSGTLYDDARQFGG